MKANIFLFTGEDYQALSEKLHRWERAFIEKHSSSNLDRFQEIRETDIPMIVNALQSEPFLADKRMIVVKGLPASSEKADKLETELLEKTLENLSESTVLIFVSQKPDKRSRLFKLLSKIATIESFEIPQGNELRSWTSQQFRRQGKSITPKALEILMFKIGQEPARLGQEIDKLCLLEQDTICEANIETCVASTPEAKIFKTLDLIGNASAPVIMKSLEQLARSGEETMMVFFMIVRQFRLLIQIRSLLDRAASDGNIQKRLKLAPFQAAALIRQARAFTMVDLKRTYHQLAEIDLEIKTGRIPISAGKEELLQIKIDQLMLKLF